MKNVLRLMRKDLRLNRLWLTGWLLVVAAEVVFASVTGESVTGCSYSCYEKRGDLWRLGGNVLVTLHLFPMLILICRIIQADSPASPTASWLTRPLSRLQVLTAKCLFLATTLMVPCLLAHVVVFAANGFSPAEGWPWLAYALLLWCCALAGAAAAASLTRDVSHAAVLAAGAFAVVVVSWYLSCLLRHGVWLGAVESGGLPRGVRGVSAIVAAAAVGTLAALLALAHQYLTRRAWRSATVLAAGAALAGSTLVLWSWDFVRAWQYARSRLDWNQVTFSVRPHSVEVWKHVWDATRPGHTSIHWDLSRSVVANGLPDGWVWQISQLEWVWQTRWNGPVLRFPDGRMWPASVFSPMRPSAYSCPRRDAAPSLAAGIPPGVPGTCLADAAGPMRFLYGPFSLPTWGLAADASDEELVRYKDQALRLGATVHLAASHWRVLGRAALRPGATSGGINPHLRILRVNPLDDDHDPCRDVVVYVQVRRLGTRPGTSLAARMYALVRPDRHEAVIGYLGGRIDQYGPPFVFQGLEIATTRVYFPRRCSADTGCSERSSYCLTVNDDWLREAELVEFGPDEWTETTKKLVVDNDSFAWDGTEAGLACVSRRSAEPTSHPAMPRLKADADFCPEGGSPAAECQTVRPQSRFKPGDPRDAYESQCAGGNAPACFSLAELNAISWRLGDDPRSGAQRLNATETQIYQKACDSGKAEVCLLLAWLYDRGQSQDQNRDPAKAVELSRRAFQVFQKACAEGNPGDCASLGRMYAHGQGVLQDAAKAAQLYQKACAEGDFVGCLWLAHMYRDGAGGMTIDPAEAARLYQKACDGGVPQACANLKE